MNKVKIINSKHQYFNLVGLATEVNEYGNVMFYPDCGTPYRTCVKVTDIELIKS